jgi:hypothetical protein
VTIKRVTAALYVMPALVLVDWINGVVGHKLGLDRLPVSPGELARGGVFLLGFGIVLLSARRELRSTLGAAVAVGVAVFPGFAVGMAMSGGLSELDKLFKVLYCPVLIAAYVCLFRRYGVAWSTVLGAETVMGAIAGASIVGFQVLGIGFATYNAISTASSGLFTAQNDIGLTMSLTLFCGVELLLTQKRPLWAITSACTIAGMLTVGTRTGTLAAFAVPVAVMWIHRREMRSRSRLPVMIGLVVLMAGGLGIAGVQKYETITSQGYQANKYVSLFEGQMPRAILLAGGVSYVARRPALRDVIGDGAITFAKGTARALGLGKTQKIVEIDWMDLFGAYGLIGLATVYAYYLWFYRRVVKLRRIVGKDAMWLGFGILSFFLLHASVAGHAIASPLPGGAMAPVLAFIWLVSRSGNATSAPPPRLTSPAGVGA